MNDTHADYPAQLCAALELRVKRVLAMTRELHDPLSEAMFRVAVTRGNYRAASMALRLAETALENAAGTLDQLGNGHVPAAAEDAATAGDPRA